MSQEQWVKSCRQAFPKFRFYLDNIDPATQKQIQNRLTLLASSTEAFFSNKCTHIVTTKPIPTENNVLGENGIHKDDILEKAFKWRIKVWSLEKLQRYLDILVNQHSFGHRTERAKERELVQLLQEEKLHGPSTSYGKGAGSDSNAPRPVFVPFRHRYVLVEEKSGTYRPVIIKEYQKDDTEPAWPTLRRNPAPKSPFMHVAKPKETVDNNAKETLPKNPTQQTKPIGQENQMPDENRADPMDISPVRSTLPQATQAFPLATTANKQNFEGVHNADQASPISSTTRASGLQPSFTIPSRATMATGTASPSIPTVLTAPTSRFVSTSESTRAVDTRRLPQGESLARLDRRMVDNNLHGADTVLRSTAMTNAANIAGSVQKNQLRAKKEEGIAKAKAKRKLEQDMNWCENCNKRFLDLNQHIQEKEHQAFVKDENNFKHIDAILATVRREYKSPLPLHMKSTVDPNIDGNDVKFASVKRSYHQLMSPVSSPSKYQIMGYGDYGK